MVNYKISSKLVNIHLTYSAVRIKYIHYLIDIFKLSHILYYLILSLRTIKNIFFFMQLLYIVLNAIITDFFFSISYVYYCVEILSVSKVIELWSNDT